MPATAAIDTQERPGDILSIPLAANTTIFQGTLVAINAAGNAVPAANTAGLRVAGVAQETVTNGAVAGALSIEVKRGVFRFANSATAAVDADDLGKVCLVEDDQTVTETASNNIKAGWVLEVSADWVWVDVRPVIIG